MLALKNLTHWISEVIELKSVAYMKLKLENLTTERWNGSYITVKTTIKKNQIDHILAPHHHRF